MDRERLKNRWEVLEGETLKTAAELTLHGLSKYAWGESVLAAMRGERVESPRLHTACAGIEFESPLMAGAGWDKKGWVVDGLYTMGFAGVEVGSVLLFPQPGNPKPRLFTDSSRGVGFNRMGFNSPGVEAVTADLAAQQRSGVVGISIGRNKLMAEQYAPWAHAQVAEKLYDFADYFVINVSSPNTPGLRDSLKPKPLGEIIEAVQDALKQKGPKPLFIKTTVDLAIEDLDKVIETALDRKVSGLIDTNTTVDDELKARYGWGGQMGGLSGDDPDFRKRANDRMKHITRLTRGTDLARFGVGGINDAPSAIERLQAGAQVLQVVTGIRQRGPRLAGDINRGILDYMDREGMQCVEELVGIAA